MTKKSRKSKTLEGWNPFKKCDELMKKVEILERINYKKVNTNNLINRIELLIAPLDNMALYVHDTKKYSNFHGFSDEFKKAYEDEKSRLYKEFHN